MRKIENRIPRISGLTLLFIIAAAALISCHKGRELEYDGYKVLGVRKLEGGTKIIEVEIEDRIKTGVLDSLSSLINYELGRGTRNHINYYLKGTDRSTAVCTYSFAGTKFENKVFIGFTYEQFQEAQQQIHDAGTVLIFENKESDGSIAAVVLTDDNPKLLRYYPHSELETINLKPNLINGILYYENRGDMPVRVQLMDSTFTVSDLSRYKKHTYFMRNNMEAEINEKDAIETFNK